MSGAAGEIGFARGRNLLKLEFPKTSVANKKNAAKFKTNRGRAIRRRKVKPPTKVFVDDIAKPRVCL